MTASVECVSTMTLENLLSCLPGLYVPLTWRSSIRSYKDMDISFVEDEGGYHQLVAVFLGEISSLRGARLAWWKDGAELPKNLGGHMFSGFLVSPDAPVGIVNGIYVDNSDDVIWDFMVHLGFKPVMVYEQ